MKKYLFLSLIFFTLGCGNKNIFLVGTWQSKCHSPTFTNNVLETNVYNKNYTFSARRVYLLGGEVEYSGTYQLKRIEDFPAKPELAPIKQYKIFHKIEKLEGGNMPEELIKKIIVFSETRLRTETEKYSCGLDKI